MKLFGKDLFKFKKPPVPMYDFAQHGLLSVNRPMSLEDFATITPDRGTPTTPAEEAKAFEAKAKKEAKRRANTPKNLFKMNALNDKEFGINTEPAYIEEQVATIKEKLAFMGKPPKTKKNEPVYEWGGVSYGRLELQSVMERLQNRAKIADAQTMLDKYPHTTNALIEKVITDNDHLKCKDSKEFVPDFPKEAINAMKEYNQMCIEICNKTTNFYVIADEDDFKKKNKRRDPILLAQSPFGLFWQVLGAWDEEMVYLADL